MKKVLRSVITTVAVILVLTVVGVPAQVAAGGNYRLEQAAIASGGGSGTDAGGNYKVEGTGGQPAAGTFASAGAFSLRGGFWAPNALAPTAAGVSVGGRVTDIDGAGLRDATVILSGGSFITPRKTRTNSFGNFNFEDVEIGHIYTLSVQHRKYGFSQNSQVFSLMDNIADLIFQAAWEN
ncbi:MAG TPA: carboxypeptidase-like regulatory domain-containing protein [Pyrinomonadaceae bacterium]|jgi:hypothetical protein